MFAVCSTKPGDYFSYANFLAADQAISAKLGAAYTFMRVGAYNDKLQEFANFLATAALETTGNSGGPNSYQNDGLYFRYENGALQNNTDPDPKKIPPAKGSCNDFPVNPNYYTPLQNPVTGCNIGLANFKTGYYPLSTFVVAVKTGGTLVNTALVMDHDGQYTTATNIISFNGFPKMLLKWPGELNNPPTPPFDGSYVAPDGYTWQYMNQIISPGYWLGMGAIQLTGDTMAKFFGWYYQKIFADTPFAEADFPDFVQNFLTDGKLGWEGALWYWNFRINGYNKPNLHSILTGPKPACHDIAITTYMINGGCNNFDQRKEYYDYFKTTIFGLSNTPVDGPSGSGVSSYTCNAAILTYCTAAP